ncbi:hypothetical protein UYO_2888 [Lachnospiraceae bacterium JC7]|nr:hypothetical protein UYO_2888 [Lachnospiraceae bacterium JC7]
MIINLSRQGLIYIPALYVLHGVIGINGLVWAQPVADVLSLVMVIVLYAASVSRLMEKDIQGTDTKYQKKKFTGQNIINKSIQRA